MSKTGVAKRNERRWLFHQQHGRCFWCGGEMLEALPPKHPNRKQEYPANLATIDHLESRLDPERGRFYGQQRHVLACKACNERRSALEVARLPKEELWRRSGRVPGGSAGGGFTEPLQPERRREVRTRTGVPIGMAARINDDSREVLALLFEQDG